MARAGVDEAWVSHLPSLFWRQPMDGNAWLYDTVAREPRFKPVPALHPGLSGWEGALGEAADRGAPAGRCDPMYYGLDPAGPEMRVLAAACGAAKLPLMMAVRLEDGRQRHPNDHAVDLPAAAVRTLIRSDQDLRLLITHADLAGGVIPAVPVPFRGREVADDAQEGYATWMAGHQVAGVAVWAHTGRGPHLSRDVRRRVLAAWRGALPESTIVAGATSLEMAAEAKAGGANALLAFPRADDPVGYHKSLGREPPVIAFYLYQAAGGVAYDNQTLHAILALPNVIGIKVATLDSVVTFQRIAGLMRDHPDKLLITGEDRFLGYSLTMGARAALIGMGAVLTDLQVALMESFRSGDFGKFVRLSGVCDRFASATFVPPVEA